MAGYTRQSIAEIIAGATVRAAPINAEYNAIKDAFAALTGHKHDGNTGEGGYIPLIADADGLNKVVVDTATNTVIFYTEVAGVATPQVVFKDGVFEPANDNDIDLGSALKHFKNAYIKGTLTVTNVSATTLAVSSNATVGGSLTVSGALTANGNTTVGNATTDTVTVTAGVASSLIPSTDDSVDIGSPTKEWRNLYVDGVGNVDTLIADSADINGGNIDGAAIGAASPSSGAFTTLTASGGITGTVTGNVTGNLTGNVTGNVTGDVVGDVTGDIASSGTSTFNNVTVSGTLNMDAGTTATIQNLTSPTNTNDAATKGYVDTSITNLIGGAPGALDTLNELAAALNDDANAYSTLDTKINTKVSKAGDVMTGNLDMGANVITSSTNPTADSELSRKAYVDAQRDTRVAKSGDTMSGALAMGGNKITGLADPTLAQDATTKNYIDTLYGSTASAAASAAAASASATDAANSAAASASSATAASNSASAASTSETNAATSESNASTSASSASTSATNASNAQSYSEEWANKAEDSLVSVSAGGNGTDEYSAKHWAAKAAGVVANNANSINDNLPTILPTLNLDFANAKTLDPRITYTRSSTATYYDEKGRLVVAASGEPRFDHDPDTLECKGLLIEEQRTNLITRSEQFDDADWTKANSSISANATTAPDGTTTADKYIFNNGTTSPNSQLYNGVNISASTAYTLSVYAKAAEFDSFRFSLIHRTGASAYIGEVGYDFDLSLGTVAFAIAAGTAPTNYSSDIVDVGNGWYRCSVTATTDASAAILFNSMRNKDTGDGTSGIYIWGAQVEAGAFPTSYISSTETFTSRASTATYYDSTGTLQTAAVDEERLSYNPADLTAPATQLFEEQRTNLFTYSETDSTNWPIGNSSDWANTPQVISGVKIDKFTRNAVGVKDFSSSSPLSTCSVFFYDSGTASNSNTVIRLEVRGSTVVFDEILFDYSTKQFTTKNGVGNLTVLGFGNGLYRVSISFSTTVASVTSHRVAIYGDATWLGGFQLEEAAYPTSYIPTTSSTVTRSADVYSSATSTRSADSASMTGDNFSEWYRQDEGTLYVDVDSFDSANAYVLTVGTASSGPRIQITYNGEHKLNTAVVDNSGTIVVANLGGPEGATSYIAAGYAENDVAISLDGSSVYTDTSCTLPTVETLFIGSDQSSGVPLNGTIRKLTYYPKRLPNATLQAMTEE